MYFQMENGFPHFGDSEYKNNYKTNYNMYTKK